MSHELLEDDRNGALLSDDEEGPDGRGQYRYRLWRTWDARLPTASFIMCNPSTADETEDDPTIRRCTAYADRWGYGRIEVGNLFALRATDPSELGEHPDPIGPANDYHLRNIFDRNVLPVAAWGNDGERFGRERERWREVVELLDGSVREWYAIGTTKGGHPWHPLRKPAAVDPEPWSGPR